MAAGAGLAHASTGIEMELAKGMMGELEGQLANTDHLPSNPSISLGLRSWADVVIFGAGSKSFEVKL